MIKRHIIHISVYSFMQIHVVLIYCNLLCAIQGLDPISIKTTDYNLINTNLVVVHLLPNHFPLCSLHLDLLC